MSRRVNVYLPDGEEHLAPESDAGAYIRRALKLVQGLDIEHVNFDQQSLIRLLERTTGPALAELEARIRRLEG